MTLFEWIVVNASVSAITCLDVRGPTASYANAINTADGHGTGVHLHSDVFTRVDTDNAYPMELVEVGSGAGETIRGLTELDNARLKNIQSAKLKLRVADLVGAGFAGATNPGGLYGQAGYAGNVSVTVYQGSGAIGVDAADYAIAGTNVGTIDLAGATAGQVFELDIPVGDIIHDQMGIRVAADPDIATDSAIVFDRVSVEYCFTSSDSTIAITAAGGSAVTPGNYITIEQTGPTVVNGDISDPGASGGTPSQNVFLLVDGNIFPAVGNITGATATSSTFTIDAEDVPLSLEGKQVIALLEDSAGNTAVSNSVLLNFAGNDPTKRLNGHPSQIANTPSSTLAQSTWHWDTQLLSGNVPTWVADTDAAASWLGATKEELDRVTASHGGGVLITDPGGGDNWVVTQLIAGGAYYIFQLQVALPGGAANLDTFLDVEIYAGGSLVGEGTADPENITGEGQWNLTVYTDELIPNPVSVDLVFKPSDPSGITTANAPIVRRMHITETFDHPLTILGSPVAGTATTLWHWTQGDITQADWQTKRNSLGSPPVGDHSQLTFDATNNYRFRFPIGYDVPDMEADGRLKPSRATGVTNGNSRCFLRAYRTGHASFNGAEYLVPNKQYRHTLKLNPNSAGYSNAEWKARTAFCSIFQAHPGSFPGFTSSVSPVQLYIYDNEFKFLVSGANGNGNSYADDNWATWRYHGGPQTIIINYRVNYDNTLGIQQSSASIEVNGIDRTLPAMANQFIGIPVGGAGVPGSLLCQAGIYAGVNSANGPALHMSEWKIEEIT